MKLITRSSAFMALALASTVAATAAAHASVIPIPISPTGSNSYQILPSSVNGGANVLSNWTNGVYSVSGHPPITTYGYNFALQSATSAVTITPQTGLKMDSATVSNDLGTTSNPAPVLALDADYQQAAVTTSLSGLAAGDIVTLTFDFAGDQQKQGSDSCGGCTGNFDALLDVTLGGASASSGLTALNSTGGDLDAAKGASQDTTTSCATENGHTPCITSQGFSGWETESLTFTVNNTSTNDVLSFLASDPNAVAQDPAFALLDNLSFTVTSPVPEPNSLLLLSTGLLGLSGYMRMRSKSGVAAKA